MSRQRILPTATWTILAFLLLLLAGPARAATTGSVAVTVQDRARHPLPGLVVEVTSAKGTTAPPARKTDAKGRATFAVVAGAGWTVRVSGGGFATQSTEEFPVEADHTREVLFTMMEAIVENVRIVEKRRVVELDEGGEQKLTISNDFAEDLPILGRSYQNVLALAPGVNDANHDGNPNVHGSRERDFKATVDGVSNVDPLTGRYMSEVNPDAIEEIEIVTTGASAEYGGAVGGFGRIITKQGTNVLAGSASIYLRSSVFDGGTVATGTDSQPAVYHDVRPSINVTGPFVKDRLFFALFHEYIDQGRPLNLLGGGGYVILTQGSRNLDKVTWQATPSSKLIFQAQADPLRTGPLGLDGLTDRRSGYQYKQGGPVYQVHWDLQPSATLNIQTLAGLSDTGISLVPDASGIKNVCGWDASAATVPSTRHDAYGNPGGPPIDEDYCFATSTSRRSGSYFRDYTDSRVRYTLKSDLSWYIESFLGVSHTVKAGVIAESKRYSASQSLRASSNWEEEPPSLANGGVRGAGAIHRTVYLPGLPDSQQNSASGSGYGAYVEDQFRPAPSLSIRIGARVDQEDLLADGYQHFNPALENQKYLDGYEACIAPDPRRLKDRCARANYRYYHTYEHFPVIGASPMRPVFEDPTANLIPRKPEQFRISNVNIAPRFSVSWDPANNGKTKLFATAGRYYGEIFLAVPSYEQGPDSFLFNFPVYPDDINCRPDPVSGTRCDIVSIIYPDSQADVAPASIRQVDRDLRTPYQDEYTAGFSRELFQETSLSVTYINRDYRDQLQDVDINHYPVYGPGGAIVGVAIYNPFFNEILRVGNFNESQYSAWQLEFTRRLHRNWELEASYVWSKATGNGEDYDQTLGNDPARVEDEFGYLDYDQRHVVKVNARMQVPSWNLRLSSALSWQSGRPFSLVNEAFAYDIPSQYGNTEVQYGTTRTTFPTHERNDQRNTGFWNLDLGARKDFSIGRASLEISLDVFNVLNDDTLYIQETLNGRNAGYRNTGRQFQLGAKVAF